MFVQFVTPVIIAIALTVVVTRGIYRQRLEDAEKEHYAAFQRLRSDYEEKLAAKNTASRNAVTLEIDNLNNTISSLYQKIESLKGNAETMQREIDQWEDKYNNDICAILSSWHHDANNRSKDLAALREAYDTTTALRRSEQDAILQEISLLPLPPERISALSKALEVTVPPDTSEGVVYVRYGLDSNIYHHSSICTDNLILATRKFTKAAGFKPCACARKLPPPAADELVYVTSEKATAYHRSSCPHLSRSTLPPTQLLVRNAIAKGYKPCNACKPHAHPVCKILF